MTTINGVLKRIAFAAILFFEYISQYTSFENILAIYVGLWYNKYTKD